MAKYKYTGEQEVNIPYVGNFVPGETYELEGEIEHPNFVRVEDKKEKKDK